MLSFQMTAFCVVVTTVVQIVMGVPSGSLVHTRRDAGISFCHKWQNGNFRGCPKGVVIHDLLGSNDSLHPKHSHNCRIHYHNSLDNGLIRKIKKAP